MMCLLKKLSFSLFLRLGMDLEFMKGKKIEGD